MIKNIIQNITICVEFGSVFKLFYKQDFYIHHMYLGTLGATSLLCTVKKLFQWVVSHENPVKLWAYHTVLNNVHIQHLLLVKHCFIGQCICWPVDHLYLDIYWGATTDLEMWPVQWLFKQLSISVERWLWTCIKFFVSFSGNQQPIGQKGPSWPENQNWWRIPKTHCSLKVERPVG